MNRASRWVGGTHMLKTKNDLSEATRQDLAEVLQNSLSEGLDLMLQSKQAHWNVKGPHFISLHELFDQVNKDARKQTDLLAERIAQLGGLVEGSAASIAQNSDLPEYPPHIASGAEHVDALSTALAAFGKHLNQSIKRASELGDEVTADILIEVARGTDKNLWFVEAHQQLVKGAARKLAKVA